MINRYRNSEYVDERHRHRYEVSFEIVETHSFSFWLVIMFALNHCLRQVNPEIIGDLEEAGLKFVGKDETGKRMEVCTFCQMVIPS